MAAPREQFDARLGGEITLPTAVLINKFANARSQEIAALTEAIEEPQNNMLAFQRMPRHLRRRAMSHNVKRMPRRLREVHFVQLEKSGIPLERKRPRGKYRHRPQNLPQEYNRRQQRFQWLETHIWHAKRFHMVEKWGYKLPHFPNDKAFRACYRATAKHCLVQDVSYLCCIELVGQQETIVNGLSQLTSPQCGLTFSAKCTLGGVREGSVTVFKQGAYPFNAIGKVTFMWRAENIDNLRTIWIWCHPAFYNEFLQELISVFQFKLEENSEMNIELGTGKNNIDQSLENKSVEKIKLETRNIDKLPSYFNGQVKMNLLKDILNRFRLTGPLSQAVMTQALEFIDIESFVNPQSKGHMDVDNEENPRSAWVSDFYSDDSQLKLQRTFWERVLKAVNSADELPPRMILAATIMDPRLSMSSIRRKAINSDVLPVNLQAVPEELHRCSAIWDSGIRRTVSYSKMETSKLNNLKSHALVPGLASAGWLGHQYISHLPILLVQNPGNKGGDRQSFGSGWDIIIPAGWGMPVWLGLIYRGARAGGLRESERLTLENATGPILPPDSTAGEIHNDQLCKEKEEKYFRLPPNKRPNYIKLGVVSPFQCQWVKLLQDWNPSQDFTAYHKPVYVLRNRLQLEYLKCLMNKEKPVSPCSFSVSDKCCGIVPVIVEMCGRGTLSACTMICTINKKDLKLQKNKSGRGPTEPPHEDKNEDKRRTERAAHLIKLKRLRRKRVKTKQALEEQGIFIPKKKKREIPTAELVKSQAELMKELWIPNEVENVKNSSSRNIIGYVTYGDYSFTRSCSFGYGFVALSALLSTLEKNQCQFLVRNVSSPQYYFVKLKLLNP